MVKHCKWILALLVTAIASPALAQGGGNGAPSGAHYNLNIIGVENPKKADMTGSNRHTIFVDLGKNGGVSSRIYLVPGAEFKVCDGNAFDAATDCQGNQIQSLGAVFQLPCNLNLTGGTVDHDGDPGTPELPVELLPCDPDDLVPDLAYEVWARALGKPGGGATMTTCATEVGDTDQDGIAGEEICSLENVMFFRSKGKQTFQNVTQELTSLVACFDTDPTDTVVLECFRYALFREEFEDWFWNYYNTGLRLAQLRFYEVVLD